MSSETPYSSCFPFGGWRWGGAVVGCRGGQERWGQEQEVSGQAPTFL